MTAIEIDLVHVAALDLGHFEDQQLAGMVEQGEDLTRLPAIGKSLEVIDDALFSAIVLMVILTTLIAPPLLKRSLQNEADRREA